MQTKLALLEQVYGVTGWKAVRLAQLTEQDRLRRRKRREQARIQMARTFAASAPRLVK